MLHLHRFQISPEMRTNHFPGQPVPGIQNSFMEEVFPIIQSKPLLQLEVISSSFHLLLGRRDDAHLATTSQSWFPNYSNHRMTKSQIPCRYRTVETETQESCVPRAVSTSLAFHRHLHKRDQKKRDLNGQGVASPLRMIWPGREACVPALCGQGIALLSKTGESKPTNPVAWATRMVAELRSRNIFTSKRSCWMYYFKMMESRHYRLQWHCNHSYLGHGFAQVRPGPSILHWHLCWDRLLTKMIASAVL